MGFHFLLLGIVGLALAIAWPLLWLRRRRMRSMVAQWARESGFEVERCEERTFSPFTFSLGKSRSQVVVLVAVIDAQGKHKTCWLKLGGYVSGLFGDAVECQWAE